MTDTNITPAAATAPKTDKRVDAATINAYLAKPETAAIFQAVGELGATAGRGADAQPAFAIAVAEAIASQAIVHEPKASGRGAKPNVYNALVQTYTDMRQSASSQGAKPESAAALVSRMQKIGEAAEYLRSTVRSNVSLAALMTDAIAYRLEHKADKGIRSPFEFLYQIAQEQVRPVDANAKVKKPAHDAVLSEDEWKALLAKPAADDPELSKILADMLGNLEKLIKEKYRGVTVLSGSPAYDGIIEASKDLHDALDALETAQKETDAKANAEAQEEQRKAAVASMTEDDMTQFMAEWRAARGIKETPKVEAKPVKGRKAA